jgi:hypothetical protein
MYVTNLAAGPSPRKYARIAGLLYLVVIVTGAFAQFFVRSKLIVPGDAAATANNIMASEWLFRFSFASDLIATISYFLLAFALYALLKPVDKNLALLFLLVVSISTAIFCLNFLNQFAALLLLNGAGYLSVFDKNQLQALALFFLDMHSHGYVVANIFFGGWLFPLGWLVFKSGFFPKILGVLLMFAAFGYLIPFFTAFLFPNYEVLAYPGLAVAVIAEVSFCLWLLIKGVNVERWEKRVLESA